MSENFSCLISRTMDNLQYNEEMRRFRINKYSDWNFLMSNSELGLTHSILAGSKIEGTSRVDESDFDYLMVYNTVSATERVYVEDNILTFLMETEGVSPGYCKLQLLPYIPINFWHYIFRRHDCYIQYPDYITPHLSSTFVVQMEHERLTHLLDSKITGPANNLTLPGNAVQDWVPAIQCQHIPHAFNNWIRRHKTLKWPSRQIMDQIEQAEVFVVPTGKHGSVNQHLEWRMSFNTAEKILIHNFNIVQYKVYILLKMIMKEVVQPRCPQSITSYIVKTIMLWAVEEIQLEVWRNENLVSLVVLMLQRLYKCVQSGFCSMYFIPEDNILEGRLNGDTQEIACHILDTILDSDDPGSVILNLTAINRTICQYMFIPSPLRDFNRRANNEKKTIVMNFVRSIYERSHDIVCRHALICCKIQGLHARIPYKEILADLMPVTTLAGSERQKFVRYIFNFVLSQFALQKCADAFTQGGKNIQQYRSVRQCVRIMNSNCHNILLKKVRLAQVLVMTGQYSAAQTVLSGAVSRIKPYMTTLSLFRTHGFAFPPRMLFPVANECLSTSQLFKHFCALEMMFDYQMEPCLPKALKYEVHKLFTGEGSLVGIHSEPLTYYLQYLCYTQLEQRDKARAALANLIRWSTQLRSKKGRREVALNVLGHCLLKEQLYPNAMRVLAKSLMLYHKSPLVNTRAAVWHIAILLNKLKQQQH